MRAITIAVLLLATICNAQVCTLGCWANINIKKCQCADPAYTCSPTAGQCWNCDADPETQALCNRNRGFVINNRLCQGECTPEGRYITTCLVSYLINSAWFIALMVILSLAIAAGIGLACRHYKCCCFAPRVPPAVSMQNLDPAQPYVALPSQPAAPQMPPSTSSSHQFCSTCGSGLDANARFCKKCGQAAT